MNDNPGWTKKVGPSKWEILASLLAVPVGVSVYLLGVVYGF